MRRLDEWFLHRVERFCHRFQRWTGKTNFWLAKLACLPVASTMALYPLDYWFDILPEKAQSPFWTVFGSGAVVAFLVLMEALRRIEEPLALVSCTLPAWLRMVRFGHGSGHPVRGLMTTAAVLAVCISAFAHVLLVRGVVTLPASRHSCGPLEALMSLGLASLIGLMYALEVNPLPPGTNKLAELKRSLFTRLVPARVPVP